MHSCYVCVVCIFCFYIFYFYLYVYIFTYTYINYNSPFAFYPKELKTWYEKCMQYPTSKQCSKKLKCGSNQNVPQQMNGFLRCDICT